MEWLLLKEVELCSRVRCIIYLCESRTNPELNWLKIKKNERNEDTDRMALGHTSWLGTLPCTKKVASMAEKFIFPEHVLSILARLPNWPDAAFSVIYLVHAVGF